MAAEPNFWFISGVFWQEITGVAIGNLPSDGAVGLRRAGVAQYPYMGTLHRDIGGINGTMLDQHGPSKLVDVDLDGSVLRFTKLYAHHSFAPIYGVNYKLKKQRDGTWFGEYRLAMGAWGLSRCFFQEADLETFMDDGERFLAQWQKTPRK